MFLLNGKKLPMNTPFTVDGVQYPANWLSISSSEERAKLRIEKVPDPLVPNEKYYILNWNVDGSVTGTPRPLVDAQNVILGDINAWLSGRLSGSDWAVVRAAEGIKPLPADIASARSAARAKAASWEARVKAAKSIEEIEAIELEMGA